MGKVKSLTKKQTTPAASVPAVRGGTTAVQISPAPLEAAQALDQNSVKGLPAEFRDAEQVAGFPP